MPGGVAEYEQVNWGTSMNSAIGLAEIVIVVIATITAVIYGGFGSWSLMVVTCFVSAMLLTPADPLSTLLLAVPALVVIIFLSPRRDQQDEHEGT